MGAADARLAVEDGVQGMVSNHGGRNLDTSVFVFFLRLVSLARRAASRPALLLLAEKGKEVERRKAEESEGLQKPQLTNSPPPPPSSPPALLTLFELHRLCPHVLDSLEVFLDGGIRRGADVLKALCLGATAVGIGHPFLYALNYSRRGVEHFIDVMRDELEVAMRLVGVTDLAQCHPGLMSTLEIDHLVPSTEGHPYARVRARL